MQCDNCGEREAEIHLTQIEEGELNTVHLCDACAEEEGVPAGGGVGDAPLADFVGEAGQGASGSVLPSGSDACPYCGTSPEDFRRTGRLGCAQCWAHFENQLEALVRRIHGSTQHVGKLYLGDAASADGDDDRRTRIDKLRRRLERAVEVEDFEAAADLRDRIEELETVDG